MKHPASTLSARLMRFWPFLLFLAVFYGVWLAVVVLQGRIDQVLHHWPISLAMAAGSYFAGSTPMGGGTVGFPVLVLLQDQPAALGRDFSFAVQSIGMTSASIYILCSRQPLEWPMLRAALLGSLVGTPMGILFLAPVVPPLYVKLLFAVIWMSFGILHLQRIDEVTRHEGITPHDARFDHRAGFLIGLIGGFSVASVTGVGIDMLIYIVLVLLCHADLRIAIATSVVLMAFTSVVGIVFKLTLGSVQPDTLGNFLAAAPIVALGAPFGALVVRRIGRRPTLVVVSILCVGQFLWTLVHEWDVLSSTSLLFAAFGVAGFLAGFEWLRRVGNRWARRQRHQNKV